MGILSARSARQAGHSSSFPDPITATCSMPALRIRRTIAAFAARHWALVIIIPCEQVADKSLRGGPAFVPPSEDNGGMENAASYKPSAFYYRLALRSAANRTEAVALGLELVAELELHKEWIRKRGLIPPKWLITPTERAAKEPGVGVPFPSITPFPEKEV